MNQGNFGAPALAVADWRRQVFALYRDIRAENDPATAHAQWQAGRNELLANHPASPVPPERRATYAGAPVAPYRTEFRFEATIETDVKPFSWGFQSATDGVIPFSRVGVLQLPVGDLDVWWLESYGGGLFVPVKDALAGTSTYGGGRYLIDTVKGADLGGDLDEFVVDLNFAYNPSCAYSPEWTCPLAPATNVIGAELPVGELTSASTDL